MVVEGTTADLLPIIIIIILCPSGSVYTRPTLVHDNYLKGYILRQLLPNVFFMPAVQLTLLTFKMTSTSCSAGLMKV